MTDLTDDLRQSIASWARLGHPALCERFVLRNGHEFRGRALPKKYQRGTPKECFANAANLVAREPHRLRYVEGYAMRSDLRFQFLHAWVIDRTNRVIDVTLERPDDCQYAGVVMSASECWAEMERTGVYGVFDHGMGINHEWMFRRDPDLKAVVEAVMAKREAA